MKTKAVPHSSFSATVPGVINFNATLVPDIKEGAFISIEVGTMFISIKQNQFAMPVREHPLHKREGNFEFHGGNYSFASYYIFP